MDKKENLNIELSRLNNEIIEKNKELKTKEDELLMNKIEIEKIEKEYEDYNFNIPNRINKQWLPSIMEGLTTLLIASFATFLIANIVSVPTIVFLFKAILGWTIPSSIISVLRFNSRTSKDRNRLKMFELNQQNFYQQLNELKNKDKTLNQERIIIQSDILKIQEEIRKLESELNYINNSSIDYMNQRINEFSDYSSQFLTDSNICYKQR